MSFTNSLCPVSATYAATVPPFPIVWRQRDRDLRQTYIKQLTKKQMNNTLYFSKCFFAVIADWWFQCVAVVSIKRKRLTVMQASNYLTAKFSIIWMTWWKSTAFAMEKLRVLSNAVTVKYGCEYIQQFCYINRCLRLTKKSTFPNFV